MEIVGLEGLEAIKNSLCLVILFPKDSNAFVIRTDDDLKKALASLLQGKEKGVYPFAAIALANTAHGRVVKKR
mgnify:CR=1 FL=1